MTFLEDIHPGAWDRLTPQEREAVADEGIVSDETIGKLVPYGVVLYVEWPEAPDSGQWIIAGRFILYVQDRLAGG